MKNFNHLTAFLLFFFLIPCSGHAAVTASPVSTTFLSFPEYTSSATNDQPTGLPSLQEDFTVETYIFLPYWPPSSRFYIMTQEGFCELSLTMHQEWNGTSYDEYFEFFFGVATGTAGQFAGKGFGTDDWNAKDNWHHLVATYTSASGELHIYFDGTEASAGWDTYTFTGTVTHTTPNTALVIGDEDDIYLDELRISTGLRYTGSFTAPTAPFDVDAQTAGLYHFDEEPGSTTFIDSSTNSNNLTAVNGTTTVRQRILTLYKQGNGKGTIRSTPSGNYCNTSCTEDTGSYAEASSVTLTAEAEPGTVFNGWSGACTGKGDCVVVMDSDLTVYASFIKPTMIPTYMLLLKDGNN